MFAVFDPSQLSPSRRALYYATAAGNTAEMDKLIKGMIRKAIADNRKQK